MNKTNFICLLFSVLGGLLLSAAWTPYGFAPLLFVGFVPLLFVEHKLSRNSDRSSRLKLFGYAYLTFLIWNTCTTWWVFNSTPAAVAAFVFNALFMAVVFFLFHLTKRRFGKNIGYLSLIVYWISFEYLHLNWDLSWPWLTLGNGFSSFYKWVQWYEYTGVLGGSLWVWLVNIFIFHALKRISDFGFRISDFKKHHILHLPFYIILFPVFISLFIYNKYQEESHPVNVVVVQPNIDPYNEKFSGTSSEQLTKILQLASMQIDSNTDYVVGPETALPEGLWEDHLSDDQDIKTIKTFISPYPKLNFVTGLSSFKEYNNGEKIPATARKLFKDKGYFDAFNTAMQIDHSDSIQLYHKSKLVPGVEKMPYPAVFGFLEKFAIGLGGTSGSLGQQDERSVFISRLLSPSPLGEGLGERVIAPVICYESIYGEYLSEYVKKGAELLFIMTNDGWWGDTPGYKQHLSYASLGAIATRRSIARSANTGISCFINQRGDVFQTTKWWTPDAIKGTINANSKIAFYTKHGDYIARISVVVAILLLLLTFVKKIYK